MATQAVGGGFVVYETVTITSGSSLSAAVSLGNRTLMAVILPAAWNTAALTFQISGDGTNCNDLYTINGEYASGSLAAGQALAVDPNAFLGAAAVKIRSGTGGTPVNQGSDRVITIVSRQVQM